jgi:hypothetical protein
VNRDAGRQRFGDRRLIRYLEQLRLLRGIDRSSNRDFALDAHRIVAFLYEAQRHIDRAQLPILPFAVHPQGYRRAGAEAPEE